MTVKTLQQAGCVGSVARPPSTCFVICVLKPASLPVLPVRNAVFAHRTKLIEFLLLVAVAARSGDCGVKDGSVFNVAVSAAVVLERFLVL